MDFNATLLGQMITFAIFVWFTMKFVWPPLLKILHDRRDAIATGLAQAEKAGRDLELAEIKAEEQLMQARQKAAEIIDSANRRANAIVDEAKDKAVTEGDRLLAKANQEIEQNKHQMRRDLMQEVGTLVVQGAGKVVGAHLDEAAHKKMLDEFIGEV